MMSSAPALNVDRKSTYEHEAHERREAIKKEQVDYLGQHPELQPMMKDFMCAALLKRPTDVFSFASMHFANLNGDALAHRDTSKDHHQRPLVISGPSGVGKGTLIAKLMADYPEVFKFSVSHTTREPRDGEEDGVHYNFSTHDKISQAISDGKFLESANVHGNIYGTSSEAVRTVVNAGKICVLDVDVQGMTTIKNSEFSPLCVFIVPPTMTELEARLRGRKTETEEAIQLRLTNAKKELDLVKPGFANAMVVNDDVDNAYDQLLNNLRTWYPKAGL